MQTVEIGLGTAIVLNIALLSVSGSALAILRDSFGNSDWIEKHNTIFSILFASLCVASALVKFYPDFSNGHTGVISDALLAFAGVGFGAVLEKSRAKIKSSK